MRMLNRNRRYCEYANPIGEEKIQVDGFYTGDIKTIYEDRKPLMVNYAPNGGEEATQIFGNNTDYSKTMCFTCCPFIEGAKVWIEDKEYKVVKIADTKNQILVALKETI